jgi:PilZ domain
MLAPPPMAANVGVQLADGTCHPVSVANADGQRLVLTGALGVEAGEPLALCWAAASGFRRAEAVVVAGGDESCTVDLGAVQPVERRLFTRHTPRMPLRADVDLGADVLEASVLDMSLGGIGLTVDFDPRLALEAEVSVRLLDLSGRPLLAATPARIAHVREERHGTYTIGLAFSRMFETANVVAHLIAD